MGLIKEFEQTGNYLFRYRSFIPLVLYAFATAVLYFDDSTLFYKEYDIVFSLICLGVSFFGIFIRILTIGYTPKATSGRNTKEQVAENINTKGIYSVVRHPLYLGNFFMWLGIIIYVGNIWFAIVCVLLFWIYYERIMFAEEMFISNKFKDDFSKWTAITPAFIPKLSSWKKTNLPFSFKNVLKREYNGFFAIIVSFVLINFLKNIFFEKQLIGSFIWLIILGAGFVIFIFLRTLKKHTKVLDVKGR